MSHLGSQFDLAAEAVTVAQPSWLYICTRLSSYTLLEIDKRPTMEDLVHEQTNMAHLEGHLGCYGISQRLQRCYVDDGK